MGVPQGSPLSVTLFALKINSIVSTLSPGVECSLYVDDLLNLLSIKICASNRKTSTAMFEQTARVG